LDSGLTLLTPQAVKIDDHDYKAAGDDSLSEWIHIQQVCTVINRRQDKGPEQRAMNGADLSGQIFAFKS
jgi:hypothetical protein